MDWLSGDPVYKVVWTSSRSSSNIWWTLPEATTDGKICPSHSKRKLMESRRIMIIYMQVGYGSCRFYWTMDKAKGRYLLIDLLIRQIHSAEDIRWKHLNTYFHYSFPVFNDVIWLGRQLSQGNTVYVVVTQDFMIISINQVNGLPLFITFGRWSPYSCDFRINWINVFFFFFSRLQCNFIHTLTAHTYII